MACDLKILLDAACDNGFVQTASTDPKLTKALVLQLLCAISQGGGTGGGGLAGSGSPEGVATANAGTTYLNTDDDGFWVKKTGTGNTGWIQLIGGA